MSIGSTAAQYLAQLLALTPPGGAFPSDDESNWNSLLGAISQTCERIDASTVLLSQEMFPDTTLELLPNWERIAGIPDACSSLADTYQIRRLNLVSKITSKGGQSKDYFINFAAQLGYTISITEFRPFQVSISSVGDPLCDTPWWFVWQVNAPLNTETFFRAGVSGAGEPLASWSNDRLECYIKKYAPAHTLVQFAYT